MSLPSIPLPQELPERVMLHANSRVAVTLEFPANEKWFWRRFHGWMQSTEEWTNEETGEVFPPTYAWSATFQGQRLEKNMKPLATHFYLRVHVSGEKDKPIDKAAAKLALERGAAEFDTYADCPCELNKNCRRHGGEA